MSDRWARHELDLGASRAQVTSSRATHAARVACARLAHRPRGVVGAPLLHSPGDVSDEVEQLHGEVMQLGQEIIERLFRQEPELRGFDIPRADAPAELLAWRRTVWVPLMDQWLKFKEAHGDSFWQNLPLSGAWDRIQDFRAKFIQARDSLRAAGMKVQGPEPIQPRRDPDPLGGLGDLWGAVRVGAYVALGVGGVLLASSAIDRLRRVRRAGGPDR